MIYAIEILNNKFIKVGFSENTDLSVRIASLQTGSPFQINPLFSVQGTLRQEQSIHASLRVAFGRIRIPMPPNEWYPGKNPFFVGFLDHLKFGAEAGMAFSECYNPALKQPGKKDNGCTAPNIKWPTLNIVTR